MQMIINSREITGLFGLSAVVGTPTDKSFTITLLREPGTLIKSNDNNNSILGVDDGILQLRDRKTGKLKIDKTFPNISFYLHEYMIVSFKEKKRIFLCDEKIIREFAD